MVHEQNIVDVTNGKSLRGIVTSSDASGYATASYDNENGYILHGNFKWLSDPIGDDFYEWWVVRKSPFAFISTGKLVKKADGNYHDNFESSLDYSEYDFYVLTLEPNDWDDAPADHILEGDVTTVKYMSEVMMKKDIKMVGNESMLKSTSLTDKQLLLKQEVKKKLQKIDFSKIDIQVVNTRIDEFKNSINEKWYSESKKKKVLELLEILSLVISEKHMMKMMSADEMKK